MKATKLSLLVAGVLVAVMLLATFRADAKEWTSVSKPGDGSTFTFRGLAIGDPMEKKFPHAPSTYAGKGVNYCSAMEHGLVMCSDFTGDRRPGEKYYPESPYIGGVPVTALDYEFLDGRFIGFAISFREALFSDLLALMEAKYGKPSSARNDVVHNRMGAAFDNRVAVWNTPHGEMKIEQRGIDIQTGRIALIDSAALNTWDARRKAASKAKGPGF